MSSRIKTNKDSTNPLFELFGQYIVVECKNKKNKIGAPAIRSFVGNPPIFKCQNTRFAKR